MKLKRIGLLPRILIAIVLGIGLGLCLPMPLVRLFVTFNGVFGQLLKFMVPFIILGLVTPAIGGIGRSAGKLLLTTVLIAYVDTNEDGVGQSITISVNSAANVSGLRIMNGYNKISTSGNDLYWANARAKSIRIEYGGGGFDYTLEDLKGEYQTINFNSPVSTTWVKITILSVYPGSMYDDCCISEIEVI